VLYVFAGILGLVFGSFLNVVIYRLPKGESLMHPPSACGSCGTPIRYRDNIPIISYVLLKGRCHACRAPISIRYPIVESLTAAAWIAAVARFGVSEEALFVALCACVFIALAGIDLDVKRLPNAIVYPAIIAAVVWIGVVAFIDGSSDLAVRSLVCGSAAFALLFVLAFVSGGMGMGDVKLAAFIGLVTGRFAWEVTVLAVFGAFLIGGVVAVALLLLGRAGRKSAIPFGPSLAAGALGAMFAGPGPVRAWLGV
jgi:leader peptidase (prepilin peptidase) / N-methyltransferase